MESTYGDRRHPSDDVRPRLASIIKETIKRGGTVIVPAFAAERTQKFLFMLKRIDGDGPDSAAACLLGQPDGDQGG